MLAGYATVKNSCSRAVAISAVDAGDFASAMIHETLVENGVSKMRHASSLPLAAHGMLRFAPGGRHLMLMNPKRQLKEGDQLGITLMLVDGRKIRADFTVRKNAPD